MSGPIQERVTVVYVHDYRPAAEEARALGRVEAALKRSLPGIKVVIHSCYGPFEDDTGIQCHFGWYPYVPGRAEKDQGHQS